MSLFNQYAAAVVATFGLEGRSWDADTLNGHVMNLPPAEFMPEKEGWDITKLHVIRDGEMLNRYMQANYFSKVGSRHFFNGPLWLPKEILEQLNTWPEWQTLAAYLGGQGLYPFFVFRNDPYQNGKEALYLGDIRLGFLRGYILA